MLFELCNVPATFQRSMRGIVGSKYSVYLEHRLPKNIQAGCVKYSTAWQTENFSDHYSALSPLHSFFHKRVNLVLKIKV
ncbi:hypothetical protein T4B_613 [Trichinella pseudospiralis]|uniref:Uncharacterized protein n=1 Tax=Trichinella pseudospiralis TaxID=6337 RepID=A0A0V1KCW7_TRIPS|nr:hypothetical protein T4B_613 [Trichinella pseudospiralis]KRZ45034.1 hypothetical protein T4C_13646 [Trichinella pseudospiralis]